MKNMRKLASVLLVLVMLFALAMPVMAADTYTLTLNGAQAGHTYTAYQIFAGDLSGDVLSNIVWGDGVNTEKDGFAAFKDARTEAESLKNQADAEAFAAKIAPYLTGGTASSAVADGVCTIAGLEAGYYLVQTTGVTATNDVYTYYIMKVVKDTSATIKADVPEVDKTVNDNDANIGDTVTFTLTATMPSNIQGYETYKVIFHDTMSAGLTFKEIKSVVVDDGVNVKDSFTLNPAAPSANETTGETTFELSCDNVLVAPVSAKESSKIVVTYTAVVDSDAVIGTNGNPNKVYLEYSNDPNADGTGKTPEKEVLVFTWEIPVFKYTKGEGDTKAPLAGAGFTLYDEGKVVNLTRVGETNVYKVDPAGTVTEVVTDSNGKFEIEGLEQGTYVLKETTTPAGYNTCADVTVVIGKDGVLTLGEETVTTVEILNQAGATLPETGGMGTTLFYVVGGLMIAAAVVLLITKRRMNAE